MNSNTFLKNLPKIALVLICILLLNNYADAQKKRRTKTNAAATAAAAKTAAIKAGAEKVGVQIKNLTKFIFVLGSVASGIEDIDRQTKEGKASKAVQEKNRGFKTDVLASIRSIRAGLVALETDFRVKPELKTYLPKVQGITDMSARAEDLALAGRFSDSGKELLLIVENLTDALAEMP